MSQSPAERQAGHWMACAGLPEQESIAGSILDLALLHPASSVGKGCARLYLWLTGGMRSHQGHLV